MCGDECRDGAPDECFVVVNVYLGSHFVLVLTDITFSCHFPVVILADVLLWRATFYVVLAEVMFRAVVLTYLIKRDSILLFSGRRGG